MTDATATLPEIMTDSDTDGELRFDYRYTPINDITVETEEDEKTGKPKVKHVLIQDEPVVDSQRFWTSLFARYGFNKAFFKYFDHAEVFQRISDVEPNDRVRVCIERNGDGSRLMAVSNPKKPLVVFDELVETLGQYRGQNLRYADGIIESTHRPRAADSEFDVSGDLFNNRFVMATPIDGYGMPNLYLSLLRQVCGNGMIGYAKAFRSALALGKAADDVTPSLVRALEGFNNDEGYAALRQRIESACKSWCSMYESQTLYKMLIRLHSNNLLDVNDRALPKGTNIAEYLAKDAKIRQMGEDEELLGSPIIKAFHTMTGDTSHLYGLANPDSLSAKRQRTLPVNCKMYDALNFATEVATHYAAPNGARMLQAWVGSRVSDEYDMESTVDKFADFADFHIEAKVENNLTGSVGTAAK